MFQMGFVDTDTCSQCTLSRTDDYLHATWTCPPLHSFWSKILQKLLIILSCRIPESPLICLLGSLTEMHNLPVNYRNPLLISLAIAKKTIFQNWKSKNMLHINHWTNLLVEYIGLEYHTFISNNDTTTFIHTWNPFLKHLNLNMISGSEAMHIPTDLYTK